MPKPSKYFFQAKDILDNNKKDVVAYLTLKEYTATEIALYVKAYEYFCKYPSKYDGATFVKDLIDLKGLDLDAMLHDYEYIALGAAHNFFSKWKSDLRYAKGIERKGKSAYAAWSRFIALLFTGIFFVPYVNIKRCIRLRS